MASHSELKYLTRQRNECKEELEKKRTEYNKIAEDLKTLKSRLSEIDTNIEELKNREIVITEHAILRYMERVKGVDIEEIKKEMVPERVAGMISQVQSGKFPVDDFYLRVKNRSVITVLTKD